MSELGDRYNEGKRRWGLLSYPALGELVKVLEYGAKKYASWNWEKGLSFTDTFECLQRHAIAWYNGEDKDQETGVSHMAHVLCNAMFLMHFIVTGKGKDDRHFKKELQQDDRELQAKRSEITKCVCRPGAKCYSHQRQADDSLVVGRVSDVQADVRKTPEQLRADGW
jgi:hypothetical protein